MKILSSSLQGYTNTQSSTIGWKEICCSKSTTGLYERTTMLRLSIASGNPEFYFTVLYDSSISNGNIGIGGVAAGLASFAKGFRILTTGVIEIPLNNSACNFDTGYNNYNIVDTQHIDSYPNTGYIDFKTAFSNTYTILNNQIYLSVYSERIDLITLSCL
jgi:hypothetical protein